MSIRGYCLKGWNTDNGRGIYVSGSAYKIVNTRAYHHGTMLVSAELDRLGNVLRNTKVY